MWQQLVPPDLNTKGVVGLCLSFQENVYHTGHPYTYALQAWRATQHKHLEQNFPDGVAVLLWWDYYQGPVNAGHVATRLPDGRLFSSPYKVGTPSAFLPSIAELERIYSDNGKNPLKYLGWSEDIAGVRIVKEDNMAEMNQSAAEKVVTYLYRLGTGDYPNPGQAEYWVPRVRDVPTGVDELGSAMLQSQTSAEFVPYTLPQLFTKKGS